MNRTCQGRVSKVEIPNALGLSLSAIAPKVYWIRDEKVLLDYDLAALYGVESRALNQAVRRNRARFPEDFMFRLTPAEADEVRHQASQSVTPVPGDSPNSSQTVMSFWKRAAVGTGRAIAVRRRKKSAGHWLGLALAV